MLNLVHILGVITKSSALGYFYNVSRASLEINTWKVLAQFLWGRSQCCIVGLGEVSGQGGGSVAAVDAPSSEDVYWTQTSSRWQGIQWGSLYREQC